MRVALLRVGIDTGCGHIYGPLFKDNSFEYIPIPDDKNKDGRTYGTMTGRRGRKLIDYFPEARRHKMIDQSVHVDPEFSSFTYGDPTRPKGRLRELKAGDMLVFYAGLKGWDLEAEPALYLIGYFEVLRAGKAKDFEQSDISGLFAANFHVRHESVYREELNRLVLVKGSENSRLLEKAYKISAVGVDNSGRPLKILSPEMHEIFGTFGGRNSIQRSPPRWIDEEHVPVAAEFVRSLQ
jgi:hypothetical protein